MKSSKTLCIIYNLILVPVGLYLLNLTEILSLYNKGQRMSFGKHNVEINSFISPGGLADIYLIHDLL